MAPKRARKILLSKPLKNFQNFFHPWKGSNFHLNSFKLLLSPCRHRSCCCRRRCCRRRCRRRHCCRSQKVSKSEAKYIEKLWQVWQKSERKKASMRFLLLRWRQNCKSKGRPILKLAESSSRSTKCYFCPSCFELDSFS